MNTTNLSLVVDAVDAYTTTGRLLAGGVVFAYALVSLIFYAIVLCALFKNRREFDNSYYIMVYYEAVADIGELLLMLILIVPCAVTNSYVYGETVTNFLANGDTLFFHTMHFYLGPIALNRLFGIGSVISKRISDSFLCKLFTVRQFVHAWMVFGLLWAATIGLCLNYIAQCPKVFFLDQLCVNYECVDYGNALFHMYQLYCPVYPAVTAIPCHPRFRPSTCPVANIE
jgi:hypothetical protein